MKSVASGTTRGKSARGRKASAGGDVVVSEQTANVVRMALESEMVQREVFASLTGLMFDGRRDMYSALGYPSKIKLSDYRGQYERGGIAERLIEAYPRATWGRGADLVEVEDPNRVTRFERETATLFKRLRLWSRVMRADILAQLSHYSVILIGTVKDDNLEAELKNVSGPDSISYVAHYGEQQAPIDTRVDKPNDPRFGLPLFYRIRFPTGKSLRVHWTRCIHVAEGTLEDDTIGRPRLRAVYNYLLDMQKILGGGAEATWSIADPGIQFDIDPSFKMSAPQKTDLKKQIELFRHNFQKHLYTSGVTARRLDGTVPAFGDNADSLADFIAGTTGIPKRIWLGSERGELSSTQDRDNWDDRVDERKKEFGEPLVRDLVGRFIEIGALPQPRRGEYEVVWPEAEKETEDGRATLAKTMADANEAQAKADGTTILSNDEIRDRVYGLDPKIDEGDEFEDDSSSDESSDPANDNAVETEIAARAASATHDPDWVHVHRVADANRSAMARAVASGWDVDVSEVAVAAALSRSDGGGAAAIIFQAVDAAENDLRATVAERILMTMADAGRATMRSVRKRGSWVHQARAAAAADAMAGRSAARPQFATTFNATNPRAIEFARSRAAALVTRIGRKTRDGIRELIAMGLREGIAPRALAARLSKLIGLRPDQVSSLERFASTGATRGQIERYATKLLRDRAVLIARTETMRAANEGQRELWRQAVSAGDLPQSAKRVWISTGDNRVREEHANVDGEVVGIDENFSIGVEPGDEPNCRCAQGIAPDEKSVQKRAAGK